MAENESQAEDKNEIVYVDVFEDDPDAPPPDWIAGFDPATDVAQSAADVVRRSRSGSVGEALRDIKSGATSADVEDFLKSDA